MRGPKTLCRLRRPTGARTIAGGETDTWDDIAEFDGVLRELTATEADLFNRETVVATHRLRMLAREADYIGMDEFNEVNKIIVDNAENTMSAQTFDITGVIPRRRGRGKVKWFQIMLREVI